ncbi:MAG TPA: hypothetical protein VHA53_01075, partial [Nitrolancea sp.]|nr:hypothetical protein [Nitrolancea sp.]
MILSGLLATTTPPTIGTVALVDPIQQTTVAVATTLSNGRFDLSCPAFPKNGLVYGFPGVVLDTAQATAALRSYAGISYVATIPAAPDVDGDYYVYVNAASSCIQALCAANPALTAEQASTEIKRRLFGPGVATFMPGYPAEFLAQVVAPDVFSPELFHATIVRAGGLAQWLAQGTATSATAPRKRPFAVPAASPRRAAARAIAPLMAGVATESTVAVGSPANDPIPTIPTSANWASNDPFWINTLDAETDFSDTASTMSETTDGIAASVGEGAITMSAADIAA